MEKDEFRKRAKELGYSEKDIQDYIDLAENAAKDGIKMDYKSCLIELPIY
jgi:hypothetical protein